MMVGSVLLIGRGHLGRYLRERLDVPDALHWTGEMADLDEDTLERLAPKAVLNTAGKTDLRWCEDNPGEAFRCNASAPLDIWRRVRTVLGPDVPYVHLSSGCVWDGPYKADGSPFEPNDPPRPACFYSWTKAFCDAMMLRESNEGSLVILRPRQVYSPIESSRNTLAKLCRYSKLIETPNSMTSAETIAHTVERILSDSSRECIGRVLNVYERGITSPFEVGVLLAKAGLRAPPEKITKANLDLNLKPKRVDVVLRDAFFERFVDPPGVQDELKRVIKLYANAAATY